MHKSDYKHGGIALYVPLLVKFLSITVLICLYSPRGCTGYDQVDPATKKRVRNVLEQGIKKEQLDMLRSSLEHVSYIYTYIYINFILTRIYVIGQMNCLAMCLTAAIMMLLATIFVVRTGNVLH